jgi:hypothetical protein
MQTTHLKFSGGGRGGNLIVQEKKKKVTEATELRTKHNRGTASQLQQTNNWMMPNGKRTSGSLLK